MKPRIHIYLPALLLACLSADSQKISKTDKLLLTNLQTHLRSLSADTAGGRAMGSPGEKSTGDYVISELSNSGVRPKGDNNGWLQKFTVDEGRLVADNALFSIDGQPLALDKEWFPLTLSPAVEVAGSPAVALQESGVPWFQDLKDWLEAAADNPRDIVNTIRAKAAACKKKGATALILYNSSPHFDKNKLGYDPKDRPEPAPIPILYISREAKRKYLKDESASVDIRIRIAYTEKKRSGSNVIAFLDNAAATTVLIGARYDNSSGLAGMIELARLLGTSKLKNNNYLFVVFSGGGPEWPGSYYYTGHPAVDLKTVNYMLELGRLDGAGDAAHSLTVGGLNTSAGWNPICHAVSDRNTLSIHLDSSAAQAGDYRSFYRHQIPLLVFSTPPGAGNDPQDPANCQGELEIVKYIYSLIESADTRGRLIFSP
jgi:aminopeptidase YwaD